MAWDIYGNRLTPGNCEVHPYVGEEYPCYYCRQDIDREINERYEREQYEKELAAHHEMLLQEHFMDNELLIVTEHAITFGRFLKVT